MSIYEKLKILAYAVPYKENNMFSPYPLFSGNIVMKDKDFLELTQENYHETIEWYLELMKKRSDDVSSILIMMSSPYRLQFLNMIEDDITQKEFSEHLAWLWIDTEFPNQYPQAMLIKLFKKSDKKLLMNKEEIGVFDKLTDKITIYRGLQTEKAKKLGLSWTLSREKALWFANRWKKKSKVYSAKIRKEDAFAYFRTRGEEEIVVNPNKLKEVMEVQ